MLHPIRFKALPLPLTLVLWLLRCSLALLCQVFILDVGIRVVVGLLPLASRHPRFLLLGRPTVLFRRKSFVRGKLGCRCTVSKRHTLFKNAQTNIVLT